MVRLSTFKLMCLFILSIGIAFPQESSLGAAATQAAKAVVPRLVRFSGTVRDAGAKPLRGPVDVTFSLYREEASGEPLWFETQTVEADAQGRYSVLLGAMHPDGLPMDLFTSGEARWLGVSVGRLPEQARVLLVAVPYALKAADADTLGGKPATAFVASDQLKDQVQSVVQAQTTQAGAAQGTRTLVGTSPTPQVIAETSPATFTCATSGVCVQSTQSGAGGIALRGTTGSSTGTAGIFDNLGGGKILSGRTTGYAEKFYVDGSGNLWAGSSLTANSYAGTSGAAVFGVVTATSGAAYGVRGQSASVSGVGAFGYATSPTGLTYGVLGSNLSASGTGLSGSASSPTGVTIGVRAVVQSPNGTAAIFDNLGGGKLLSARTTSYVEKFSVASNGNLTASGTLSGTRLISSIATGTAPLTVASTTLVPNLYVSRAALADSATSAAAATNALSLGGVGAADYARRDVGNSLNGNQGIVAPGAGAKALDVQASDLTAANTAIYGRADGPDGSGVVGEANNGSVAFGVWGISSSGYAGQFDGDVNVTGTLSKTGGSFKIDHPLDPANKYLLHSFVESPDMMNIYNGNATLDANGEATIELAGWFEALNREFRYQLTAIGAPGPNLYVAEEIRDNQFRIAGGSPGMRVSWQVTGVRHDAWANAHRIAVEVEKPAREKGSYLHPQLFGAPAEQSVSRARRPER